MPRRSATPCSPSQVSSINRQGGPYVPTHRTDSGEVVVDESTAGATRRSVYLRQRRTEITSLLEVFDAPSIVTTCTRRLSLDNPAAIAQPDEFRLHDRPRTKARHEARARVQGSAAERPYQRDTCINQAFLLTIGREPEPG